MASSGMLLHVAIARTNFLEELSARLLHNLDEGGAKFLRNFGSYKSHTA
jgi:hypothetical protein